MAAPREQSLDRGNRCSVPEEARELSREGRQKEKCGMGPIGLILFILAGIYGVRRGKITSLSPTDFPTVPPDRFEAWRRLELKSIDIFLLVAAAVFAMSILGQIVVSLSPHGRNISPGLVAAVVLIGAAVLTFFVGLTVSAVIGSKATRLKKSLGIHWSEKQ